MALGPCKGLDLKPHLHELEQGLHRNSWRSSVVGMMLYRVGRFTDAIKLLTPAESADDKSFGPATDEIFLAMAHHRAGHAKEARRWYDRVVAHLSEQPTERRSFSYDDLTVRLLREEAEQVLGIVPPPKP